MASAAPAFAAAPCGGDFAEWVAGIKADAVAAGEDPAAVDAFFAGAKPDARVIKADRSQGVFRKSFLEFSQNLISRDRLQKMFDPTLNERKLPPLPTRRT